MDQYDIEHLTGDMVGLLDAVLEQAQKVRGSIERLWPAATRAEYPAGPTDDARNCPAIATALRQLAAAVDAADVTGCSESLAALVKIELPPAMARMLSEIQGRIDEYEYDEAGQIIARWLQALSEKEQT